MKHGPATYIISLPSKWVKQYHIDKGDELEVEEEGNSLRIFTDKGKRVGSVDIDVSGLDRSSLMYLLRSLYKLGYDEIRVSFKNQSTVHYRTGKSRTIISIIHEELARMSGMEIIQQRENLCVLKALSEASFSECDTMMRRIFLLLIDTMQDIVKAAEKKDTELLMTIENKHNTITKFISFCIRLLNKRGYPDQKKTLIVYSIISNLEKILDIIKNTSRYLLKIDTPITNEAVPLSKKIHQCLVLFYELYYRYDKSKILKISEIRDTMMRDILESYNHLCKKDLIIVLNLIQINELIMLSTELRMAMEY